MRRLLPLFGLSLSLLAQIPAPAIPSPPAFPDLFQADAPPKGDADLLLGEIGAHSRALADLEELSDDIGGRPTGSPQLLQAEDWAMEKLKAYGAVNVHKEAYAFGRPWTRGVARARLLGSNGMELHVLQTAWTPPTKGAVRGEAVFARPRTLADMKALFGHLDGKFLVLASFPEVDWKDPQQAKEAWAAYQQLDHEPYLALLQVSDKGDGLMDMYGSPDPDWAMILTPKACLAKEQAQMLERLARRGKKVELEVELGGDFGPAPVQAHNIVGELRGSEKPEEVVIVGGHLDSWDLATGASDNGTGVVASLEVLRAMNALHLKPKRTLRIVFFTGEEQGTLGSTAYVKAHAAELPKVQSVLIDDLGGGRITGWFLGGREDLAPQLAAAMAPANVVGCQELVRASAPYASDNGPFSKRGVPSFLAWQTWGDYFSKLHHSQVDDFDHVVPADLVQGSQALAATAWGLLNGERLPQGPDKTKPAKP